MTKRPPLGIIPLGIIPKPIFEMQRMFDLNDTIRKYLEAELTINEEWVTEYNELVKKYKKDL